jgi:deoxyribonuclease V
MKLAVAVHHDPAGTRAAAFAFDAWEAAEPERTYVTQLSTAGLAAEPAAAEPAVKPATKPPTTTAAELKEARALACLLQLLREHALAPEVIVFDGSVHLDAAGTPGPGHHLHAALGGACAVIGASKATRPVMPAQFEVHREDEARPLTVTCVGIDLGAAKARLRAMHGKRRVPTLLKRVARLAKGEPD